MKVGKKNFIHNCPVANWEVYLSRRLDLYGIDSGYRWTISQAMMCASFKSVVLEALRKASHNAVVAVRPHQVKKLSVPYVGSTGLRPKK